MPLTKRKLCYKGGSHLCKIKVLIPAFLPKTLDYTGFCFFFVAGQSLSTANRPNYNNHLNVLWENTD